MTGASTSYNKHVCKQYTLSQTVIYAVEKPNCMFYYEYF